MRAVTLTLKHSSMSYLTKITRQKMMSKKTIWKRRSWRKKKKRKKTFLHPSRRIPGVESGKPTMVVVHAHWEVSFESFLLWWTLVLCYFFFLALFLPSPIFQFAAHLSWTCTILNHTALPSDFYYISVPLFLFFSFSFELICWSIIDSSISRNWHKIYYCTAV